MKIGVLCSSEYCLPSLSFLLQQGVQLYLILPKQSQGPMAEIVHFANHYGIPTQHWSKEDVATNLVSWSILNELNYIWVITFPYILAKKELDQLKVPILNFHFAPLPEFGGVQPVFWMIKKGVKKGGISIHVLTEKIDGGPLLHFESYIMGENETFGSYLANMSQLNVLAIQKLLQKLEEPIHEALLKKQSHVKYWGKPTVEDIMVDWERMSAEEIVRLCRSGNPWNKGALTRLGGRGVNLIELSVVQQREHHGEIFGTIVQNEFGELLVSTKDHKYVRIELAFVEGSYYSRASILSSGMQAGFRFV